MYVHLLWRLLESERKNRHGCGSIKDVCMYNPRKGICSKGVMLPTVPRLALAVNREAPGASMVLGLWLWFSRQEILNLVLLLLKRQLPLFLLLLGSLHFSLESPQKRRCLFVDHSSFLEIVNEGIVRIKNALFQNGFRLGLANDLVDTFAELVIFGLEYLKGFLESIGETLLAEAAFLGMKSISFPERSC